MAVVIPYKPKVMDADPHGAQEFVRPVLLGGGHRFVVDCAILRLEETPFFGEFTAEEMSPADCLLLFKENTVFGWVFGWIQYFLSEEPEETFVKNIK